MKKTFTLLLSLAIAFAVQAQLSYYEHPCSIVAQQEIKIPKNAAFDLSVDALVIHDVDDNKKPFELTVLDGENYKIEGNKIKPKKNFEGLLCVNVKVNDGKFDSNIFPLKIEVGEAKNKNSKTIYVATNGNDNNPGSLEKPLKTIYKAQEKVRQGAAREVVLCEGEYYMPRSLTLEKADGGTESDPVIYRALEGDEVRLTGSVALPYEMFKKADKEQLADIDNLYVRAKIKVIDLAQLGVSEYGELSHIGYGVKGSALPAARLYIDGAAQQLARYPNVGNFDDVRIMPGEQRVKRNIGKDSFGEGEDDNKIRFKSKTAKVLEWKQKDDIWIDGSLSKAWEWQKNKIARIDADSTVTMAWDYYSKIGMQSVKMFYFNIFEELDFPEEYFIDREKGLLYVYFPANVGPNSDIRITQSSDNLVRFAGAEHVHFKNIVFEGTRNSAIDTSKPSSFNRIENCEIFACGLDGISLNGYGNKVLNTLIHNVGASGVTMQGGDYKNLIPANNVVENTLIHDFSQEHRVYRAGIHMGGVGQIARHVELFNGPHMAARIHGANHIIEYCDFYDAPREYSDMLGIYLCTGGNFFDRGTIIRRNKFHDVDGSWKQSAGVYLDNETNGVVVEENFFFDNYADQQGWATMIHGGGDNQIRRNVYVDCSYPFAISTRLNGYARGWFEEILVRWQDQAQKGMNEAWRKAYPELVHYFDDGYYQENAQKSKALEYKFKRDEKGEITNYWNMRTPSTNVFEGNLVYNSDPEIYKMEQTNRKKNVENREFYTVANFQVKDGEMYECLQTKNNHHAKADPGFVNYKEHDLRLDDDAKLASKLPHLTEDYYTKIGLSDKSNIGTKKTKLF